DPVQIAGVVPRGGPPFELNEKPGQEGPGRGVAAEVEARHLAPGQRQFGPVDHPADPLRIGFQDLAEELVAAGQSCLVLARVALEVTARLGESDESQVVEVCGEVFGRIALPRTEAREAHLGEGPAEPFPVGELVPVDAELATVGGEAEAQTMPARRPGQPLY